MFVIVFRWMNVTESGVRVLGTLQLAFLGDIILSY